MMPPPVAAHDVPLLIVSTATSSERRITPSWSIAHLKTKLEPVTGIPPSAQKLSLRLPEQQESSAVEAEDEDAVQIGQWPLVPYAELTVRMINQPGNWLATHAVLAVSFACAENHSVRLGIFEVLDFLSATCDYRTENLYLDLLLACDIMLTNCDRRSISFSSEFTNL